MARCNVIEYHGRQCTRKTYLKGNTCIWHKVLDEFRTDMNRFGGSWPGQFELWGAGYAFAWAIVLINNLSRSLDLLLLMPLAFVIGNSLKLFADGTMAINGPLSNFVFWAKTLAVGMIIELSGCLAMGIYIVSNPTGVEPLLRPFTQNEWWLKNSGLLLAIILFFDMYTTLHLLTKRVLFRQLPMQDFIVYAIFFTIVGGAISPYMQKISPFKFDLSKPEGWLPVFGTNSPNVPLGIAFFAGFILCELINSPMRMGRLTREEFKNTVTISYSACLLPPMIGIVASRFLLPLIGIEGTIPFVISVVIISLILGWIATNWLINYEISKRYSSPWP